MAVGAEVTRYFFDTEFIEDGKTIELLSIGIVAEDGREFYAEAGWTDKSKAHPWVVKNVLPHLGNCIPCHSPKEMRGYVANFLRPSGEQPKPELWAYYCSYDWVVLCQLWGKMIDLPDWMPMYCNDLKMLLRQIGNPKMEEIEGGEEHNALHDAREVREWFRQARTLAMLNWTSP